MVGKRLGGEIHENAHFATGGPENAHFTTGLCLLFNAYYSISYTIVCSIRVWYLVEIILLYVAYFYGIYNNIYTYIYNINVYIYIYIYIYMYRYIYIPQYAV